MRNDEIAGRAWHDDGELTEYDKQALDQALSEYENSPDAGRSWAEAEMRILKRLGMISRTR
jgi:hypothetical protein